MSYSAAKRHARSLPKEVEWIANNVSNDQAVEGPITFNDTDIQNVQLYDDALMAEKKNLEAQVDRLINDMKGVENDFKSNITEVYLRTRIDMMKAYIDGLHHA